jgi:hypothetical protein
VNDHFVWISVEHSENCVRLNRVAIRGKLVAGSIFPKLSWKSARLECVLSESPDIFRRHGASGITVAVAKYVDFDDIAHLPLGLIEN